MKSHGRNMMSTLRETDNYPMPPGEITGPSVWYGPDLERNEMEWLRPFSDEELGELDAAMRLVKSMGMDIINITKEKFPLPSLAQVFNSVRKNILRGRGIMLLRGIPVEDYSIEEIAILYFGIGAHFGMPLPQNAKGHLLGHVKNIGRHEFDTKSRIYQTNVRQTFHTDASDIVSLLCLKPAKIGGESAVVSSDTIYNEILRRRPDLLPFLFQPYATDWRNESPSGGEGYYNVPVFSWFLGLTLHCKFD